MRLIDADAFMDSLVYICDAGGCLQPITIAVKAFVKGLIARQPTIEPRRGKWIGKYPVTSACSECNYLIHDSKVKAFAFCPNCGSYNGEKVEQPDKKEK